MPRLRLVSVTARTVRVLDRILIGGRQRRIEGVEPVPGGARLSLDTGERLIIGSRQEYTVTRPVAAPDRERRPHPGPGDPAGPAEPVGVAESAGPAEPAGPAGDGLSSFCTAARAGGPRWRMLHGHCRGPMVLTVPGAAEVVLPCACPCHLGEAPE